MEFHHISVLMAETVRSLVTNPDGVYVDCTLGGGGHARQVIERLSPKGRLIGIDQDPAAIAAAQERLSDAKCRVDIINKNFKQLEEILEDLDIRAVDGVLFDLGVSSHQLDQAERGFSYMQDAPLDMRMDPAGKLTAFTVVNHYDESQLAQLIFAYGEERWAKRIAQFIAAARAEREIQTTGALVDLIKRAIPAAARKEGGHPAKRTFQAIRIEVNHELAILADAFGCAVHHLHPGGRLCVITFHSLEDRIAKQTLSGLAKGCICPPRLPICVCGHRPEIRIIGKPLIAGADELKLNSRAKSAKLRVAERC